jgi:hypothetical protein
MVEGKVHLPQLLLEQQIVVVVVVVGQTIPDK